MPNGKSIRYAHILDAGWILALWKAIHGGDPGPEQMALEAIAALSETLTGQSGVGPSQASFEQLQARLKEIGVDLQAKLEGGEETAVSAKPDQTQILIARTFCTVIKGQSICITFPKRGGADPHY
jgi:hypothetical protein